MYVYNIVQITIYKRIPSVDFEIWYSIVYTAIKESFDTGIRNYLSKCLTIRRTQFEVYLTRPHDFHFSLFSFITESHEIHFKVSCPFYCYTVIVIFAI